ncbi:MAG TPA: circularly permuted type 2 ATP-grasp protein [Opitutaceae bacterium]|nr:circularly permuted type 2 ATP-grasp protein [Opitutaceae bacterium]
MKRTFPLHRMPAAVRPSHFPRLHPRQLQRLRTRLRVSIRESGLSEASSSGHSSRELQENLFWDLDPSPLVIDADEWSRLEAALIQRARFTNAFLVDVYSRQEVLTQRLLPPEIVLADPYYRRPCLHLEPDRQTPATLLRFDLVNTVDGWQFTGTRANTPIGLGFAVQNRRLLSQEAIGVYGTLPDYHSIINFPLRLLDGLRELAPHGNRSPSIVVLTAGPNDPFYAEHSFLARKMGLPLARGDDLLVLDNAVYFKTISGLERVDVIYRRLNDAHIDPVVFSTDRETAGVPGLLQCIRTGNVALANSIGCGVADSRALDAYLPKLMRFYLGEKPLLPSVPTLTCGDTDQLDDILSSGDSMSILAAHDLRIGDPRLHQPPVSLLDEKGLARVVRENPHAFVARPRVESRPIALDSKRTAPFHFSAFVLSQGGHYTVLPGGLARLGATPPSVDRVGVCADTIVLQGNTVSVDEGPDIERPKTSHRQHELGSRSAETLFWLGRYLERAEATARMLAIFEDVALEEIPSRDRRYWVPIWRGLLEATGHSAERISAKANPHLTLTGDLNWRMTLSVDHPSSIASSVAIATENGRQLRDYVSPEAWVLLSRLGSKLDQLRRGRLSGERRRKNAATGVQLVLTDINAFFATAERTMLMDSGWEFLLMGVHLERAIMTCSALRHILGKLDDAATAPGATPRSSDAPELSALLRMLGSQDAYRRLYQTRSEPRLVAALFLQQPDAPRSLFYNLHRIKNCVRLVAASTPGEHDEAAVDAVKDLLQFIAALPIESYFGPPSANAATGVEQAKPGKLSDYLAKLLGRLYDLYPLLSDHYFSHQARVAVTLASGAASSVPPPASKA